MRPQLAKFSTSQRRPGSRAPRLRILICIVGAHVSALLWVLSRPTFVPRPRPDVATIPIVLSRQLALHRPHQVAPSLENKAASRLRISARRHVNESGVVPPEISHSGSGGVKAAAGGTLRLDLALPPSWRASSPSLLNQALNDPRANSLRLSTSERFSIGLGANECIYQERRPDGSVGRLPGHLVENPPTIAAFGVRTERLVRECVKN